MSDRKVTAGLTKIRAAISSTLARIGFSGPTESDADGRRFERWIRSTDWKREVIEIDYPKRNPDRISAKALVSAILDEEVIPVDGVSLPYLSRGMTSYTPPSSSFRAEAQLQRVIAEIEGDLTAAIRWLENYSTRDKCLEQMRRTDRNGCAVGSSVWFRVREALGTFSETS